MTTLINIVDDHPLVRQGLSQVINNEADMEICGEAEDAPQAMKGVGPANPDVIIVDISLRGNNGLELIKNLKAIHENIHLVFSMHDESIYAQRALRAGAKAFVMKKESLTKVLRPFAASSRGNQEVIGCGPGAPSDRKWAEQRYFYFTNRSSNRPRTGSRATYRRAYRSGSR